MIENQKLQKTLIVTQLTCRGLNKNKIEILSILKKPCTQLKNNYMSKESNLKNI